MVGEAIAGRSNPGPLSLSCPWEAHYRKMHRAADETPEQHAAPRQDLPDIDCAVGRCKGIVCITW